jgi:hypothetical protein
VPDLRADRMAAPALVQKTGVLEPPPDVDMTGEIDIGPSLETTREITRLYGTGAGIPAYLKKRIVAMSHADPRTVITVEPAGDGFIVQPGPEMLAIVATLRALRKA